MQQSSVTTQGLGGSTSHTIALLVFLSFLVPNYSLFANFSPFPPISANFHPYSTILDLLPQLFHLYNMNVGERGQVENLVFGSYCLNPWTNLKMLAKAAQTLSNSSTNMIDLIVGQPNFWEIFHDGPNMRFEAKSCVNF